MVISDGVGWRKVYYQEACKALNPIANEGKLPDTLTLPISSSGCMFELGGSKYSSGKAILIATPSGFPNAAIALKNRVVNGVHAASRVWIGCLIGIAHHQFGITTIGIYLLTSVESTPDKFFKKSGKLKLITGLVKEDPAVVHQLNWLSPYDKTYPGIKKLAVCLLKKLEMFECKIPLYIEPFRIIHSDRVTEPKFKELINNASLIPDNTLSDLTPLYIRISKSIAEVKDCDIWMKLENTLVDTCYQYHFTYPFVYVLFCHHVSNEILETHAFVCFQRSNKSILEFHHTGWKYTHTGIFLSTNKEAISMETRVISYDFQSYLANNYNNSFFYALLGIRGGGIKKLLSDIEKSKDRCTYVLLKYALCIKSYR